MMEGIVHDWPPNHHGVPWAHAFRYAKRLVDLGVPWPPS